MSRGCTTSQMVFAFWRETFSSTGRILQMALAQQMFGNIKSPYRARKGKIYIIVILNFKNQGLWAMGRI